MQTVCNLFIQLLV